jgi:hypothetical protein
MAHIIEEYLKNDLIITQTFNSLEGILLKKIYLNYELNNKNYIYNYSFIGIHNKIKTPIYNFNAIYYRQNSSIFLAKNYKFGQIINLNIKQYKHINFYKKKSEFLSLFKDLKIQYYEAAAGTPFKIQNHINLFDVAIQQIELNFKQEYNNLKKTNTIFLPFFNRSSTRNDALSSISSSSFENEDMINKRLDKNKKVKTLSISSSSFEDEDMINKRLNKELDRNTTINTLFIDSSSNQNNRIIFKKNLNQELNKFIKENSLSFYKNKQKNGYIVVRNLNMPSMQLKDYYEVISYSFTDLPNNPYSIQNSSLLRNLNIPVYDGSTFFIEDDNASSPNLLINYLQKIKKNHKNDDDALIFCFNILKQYNHINNENLFIYLNLFNTNIRAVIQNVPNHVVILEQKILTFPKNILNTSELTDLKIFNEYLYTNKYREANNMLNKYNSTLSKNKEFNFIILRLISYLQYRNFYEKEAEGRLWYILK